MPILTICTNVILDKDAEHALLSTASRHIAKALSKPERYVMTSCQSGCTMLFAGTADPLAYLELKSIGLQQSQTEELSAMLAELINNELKIPANRLYIEFSDAPRTMWGWNSGTF